MEAVKPKNEEARLATLEKYAILDTDPELAFDDLVLLASVGAGFTVGATLLRWAY